MSISFNHTIVASRDKRESAEFLAELFGLPSPKPMGRFMAVELEHGATLVAPFSGAVSCAAAAAVANVEST